MPVDPLLNRFHEVTQVYGAMIKALIHEKFGVGIMSAIDFELSIDCVKDPKGERVRVTYCGEVPAVPEVVTAAARSRPAPRPTPPAPRRAPSG